MISRIDNKSMDEFPLMQEGEGITLFTPYIAPEAFDEVKDTLNSRWIGQGPKVDLFEKQFKTKLTPNNEVISTGSGTDSLHLAYLLAGVSAGDEVITTVFTCTATNLPILYNGAVPVFADIDPLTMNIDVNDIEHRITKNTKAIVAVDYGGIPAEYEKLLALCSQYNLFLISDAAQSLGSQYQGKPISDYADFTTFSFQAIKTITTADGGMLALKNKDLLDKAKRLRWFGIDRTSKQKGTWENDIYEVGYKYQMSDLSACLGLTALKNLDKLISHRQDLLRTYVEFLNSSSARVVNVEDNALKTPSPWLCTLILEGGRLDLMKKLREKNIESAQVHYRNDRYSVFGSRREDLPNMDSIENNYLVLPLHHNINSVQVEYICSIINSGW